jgi:hypothetical protein
MKAAFDIFEKLPDGHLMWVESVGTLDQARKKVRELTAARTAHEYLIYSEHNGVIQHEQH